MRKYEITIIVLVFIFGFAKILHAGDTTVMVGISEINALSISDDEVNINLRLSGGAGSSILTAEPNETARLNYSHNSKSNKRIIAEVKTVPEGEQDITLKVSISGSGIPPRSIVEKGKPVLGGRVVYDNIPAGALHDKKITYFAEATVSGTRPGTYTFTITYTPRDVY